MRVEAADLQNDPFYRTQQSSQLLAEADLVREAGRADTRGEPGQRDDLSRSTHAAWTRGRTSTADIKVPEWNAYVRDSQDSLRVIADETGGFAMVNTNDFTAGLKRIDAETSDYYVLAYSSSNPDPLKRVRRIEVKTTRPGATVFHRTSYTGRPRLAASAPATCAVIDVTWSRPRFR